jgi:hypothetical protein
MTKRCWIVSNTIIALLFGTANFGHAKLEIYEFRGQSFTVSWIQTIGQIRIEDAGAGGLSARIVLHNLDTGDFYTLWGGGGTIPTLERSHPGGDLLPVGSMAMISTVSSDQIPNGRIEIWRRIPGMIAEITSAQTERVQDIFLSNVILHLPLTRPPIPAPSGSAEVHAVVISAQAHPERAFRSDARVHLTGGVAALGRQNPSEQSVSMNWPAGLTITPDEDYLTGRKVPPLTPNIVDVRIRNFRAGAEIERQRPSASKTN